MSMPKRNAKGRFVKSGGSHRKKNPSKGRMCAKCHVHHESAATARRAHAR